MIDYALPSHYTDNRKKYFSKVKNAEWTDWKWQLKNAISNYSWLEKNNINYYTKIPMQFLISPYFFCLINHNDANNPLAMQVFPNDLELTSKIFTLSDPFFEENNSPIPGVIKRFKDRIVVVSTNKCASLCRFCTRKWNWDKNICIDYDFTGLREYLKSNPQIREVIISGGEPFLLDDNILDNLLNMLFSLSSIESVRIGTRILSFLPYRITDNLCNILSKYKPLWIMSHFNHPDEIRIPTQIAINKLIKAGVVINNQSVLLYNINNNIDTLNLLFRKLVNLQIKPYYLFQCDPIKGIEHFAVKKEAGKTLIKSLIENLSGLCIPQFVEDTKNNGKVRIV